MRAQRNEELQQRGFAVYLDTGADSRKKKEGKKKKTDQ